MVRCLPWVTLPALTSRHQNNAGYALAAVIGGSRSIRPPWYLVCLIRSPYANGNNSRWVSSWYHVQRRCPVSSVSCVVAVRLRSGECRRLSTNRRLSMAIRTELSMANANANYSQLSIRRQLAQYMPPAKAWANGSLRASGTSPLGERLVGRQTHGQVVTPVRRHARR